VGLQQILETLGLRLKEARQARGLSLQEAADRAGVSRRFLVEAEAGRTNPTLGRLAALAGTYGIPLRDLCDLPTFAAPPARIALIGLRGAGKSTLGRMLAEKLEIPFAELDDIICELAGLSVSEIFELHGGAGYRKLERAALEEWLARHGSGVLAVPGGIVSSPGSFERLRATCRTLWLTPEPEEHWQRVVTQGDLRPMKNQPRAMEQLQALLEQRIPLYRLADVHLDTSGKTPEECLERALAALQ